MLNQSWLVKGFPFFFPFIFISWRLITLQHCSCFGHTLTWISHGFTCVPHLNPPSRLPKSVLYICVSFTVLHTGLSLPSFKIPYICISILYWSLCFWLTSLCIMGSSFIHLIRTDSHEFFFNGLVIFHWKAFLNSLCTHGRACWSPRLGPGLRPVPHPPLYPTWTHMLEDKGNWGPEVLSVLIGDKGRYDIWQQDVGGFLQQTPVCLM